MQHPYQCYGAQVFVWSPGAGESVKRRGGGVKVVEQPHLSVGNNPAAVASLLRIPGHVVVWNLYHVF